MAHLHEVADEGTHYVIDKVAKKVLGEKLKVAQYSHNSEIVTFEIPRYVECHDMMKCDDIRVHYTNVSKNKKTSNKGVYEVKNKRLSEDENTVLFSWEISNQGTQIEGTLQFSIWFTYFSDAPDYEWGTETNKCLISIVASEKNSDVVVQEYPDVLDKWKNDLFSVSETEVENVKNVSREEQEAISNKSSEAIEEIENLLEEAESGIVIKDVKIENGELKIILLSGEILNLGVVKGDKGDAGSIEFKIVPTLPTEDISESTMYLVPLSTGDENNEYAEYIYVNGHWEYIGSATVDVNLDEYVKNTDVAKKGVNGIVNVDQEWGIFANNTGGIYIQRANERDIDCKTQNYRPITPLILDYATMKALTDPKNIAWNDTQKALARATLGALANPSSFVSNNCVIVSMNGTISTIGYTNYHPFADQFLRLAPEYEGDEIMEVANGYILSNTPTRQYHTANKKYVDDGFVAKTTVPNQIYGSSTTYDTSLTPLQYAIPRYNVNGTLASNTPENDKEVANKKYVDDLIAELRAEIEALKG